MTLSDPSAHARLSPEEDRDADADGSRALAIIVSKASYEREAATGLFDE